MTYLYVYLGLGSIMAIGVMITACFFMGRKDAAYNFLNRANQEKENAAKRFFAEFPSRFVILILIILVIPLWPLLLYFLIRHVFFFKAKTDVLEEKIFSVTSADLIEKMSLSDVEIRERVTDPLGAVPDLPFGHLNAAWRKFLEEVGHPENLWFFSAKWSEYNWQEIRQGYVIVDENGKIGPHFTNSRKMLGDTRGTFLKEDFPPRFDIPAFLRKQAD